MMAADGQWPGNPEVLASNKTILQRRFAALSELVDSFAGHWPAPVHAQATRSGLPTIAVDNGTAMVHVHSTFQPVVEAERWAKEPLEREWDFAVIVGLGLGYHVEALLERRPQCRLVVIEPRRDVFYAAMALREQRGLLAHPHLDLIVAEDPVAAAKELFHGHLKELLDEAPVFVWPAATRYAPDYRKRFESQLVDMLRSARGNVATSRSFQLQWINNFFGNVPFAPGDPGVSALKDELAGRPAIIAAAGPSLEKNVHLLAEAKGKAVIIAAGSTINPLLKHGIEPDLLVSFDPGQANYRHFEHLHTPQLPLVYIPTILPIIIEEYKGPRFTAAMDVFPFVGWLFEELGQDKGLLSSGPSVANVSWHLAMVLGLNPIILVGQDLAYTDGKTHASGAAHARTVELESPEGRTRFITTEGVDGTPVVTDVPMYNMKVWFEQRLMNVPAERMTIDATEGGAKIAGTTMMPLAEALGKFCRERFDPYDTIMSVHRAETARLGDGGVQERLSSIFSDLREQLLVVERLTKDALDDAERLARESLTRRLSEQRFREATTRLLRHSTRMVGIPVYKVFIESLTGHILHAISSLMQARQEKETDLYRKGAEVAKQYSTLFTSARDMARHIDRLLKEQMRGTAVAVDVSADGLGLL